MESTGGEDLSYFWRGWYFHNWQLDLAVTGMSYTDGDPAKGVRVTVENGGQLVLPAKLRIELADGSHTDVAVPAETWLQNATHTFVVPTTSPVRSATIDPDHQLPDVDRSNNSVTVIKSEAK
jgi:bifunctional DNA-binding transcriptional regulator/antitoxin component of YhaV-PrlF toxin-antitoxin module